MLAGDHERALTLRPHMAGDSLRHYRVTLAVRDVTSPEHLGDGGLQRRRQRGVDGHLMNTVAP